MISFPEGQSPIPAKMRSRNRSRQLAARAIPLVLAALLLLSGVAGAQSNGRIFFLDQQTGDYLIGGIDPSGWFHSWPAGSRSTLAGTTSVAASSTSILAYNRLTGYSEFVVIDGFGKANFHPQNFGTGFPYLVGSAGYFFFYSGNANTAGTAAVISTLQDGYFESQTWSGGLSPWSSIVRSDDYLLFYNFQSGLFVETDLSAVYHGQLRQNSYSVRTIAKGYSVVQPVDDNVILYNSTTGAFQVMGNYLLGNGNDFPIARGSGTLKKYYGAILPSLGRVVFYSYGNGDTLVGHLTQAGQWVTEHESTLPQFTSAFTSGPYVVFYNAVNGLMSVYGVNTAGVLTLRSSQTIGTGYTSVTATKF